MKARKVIVTIEVESTLTIKELKARVSYLLNAPPMLTVNETNATVQQKEK